MANEEEYRVKIKTINETSGKDVAALFDWLNAMDPNKDYGKYMMEMILKKKE